MEQNFKDRLLSLPRAVDLTKRGYMPAEDITVQEARERLGLPHISDEELLLRTIMQGEQEIDTMRAAGPPKTYTGSGLPLRKLMEELNKCESIRYVQVQNGTDKMMLQNRVSA